MMPSLVLFGAVILAAFLGGLVVGWRYGCSCHYWRGVSDGDTLARLGRR